MTKILNVDNNYEEVMCPVCGHRWYKRRDCRSWRSAITCPSCGTPLQDYTVYSPTVSSSNPTRENNTSVGVNND